MKTVDAKRPYPVGGDPEMVKVLEEMIEGNEDITARAVARRHPKLAYASAIIRSPVRTALLAEYQAKQQALRITWQGLFKGRSYAQLAAELAYKDKRIAELERQVEIVKAIHRTMIQAVAELDEIEGHHHGRDDLEQIGAVPIAEVKNLTNRCDYQAE